MKGRPTYETLEKRVRDQVQEMARVKSEKETLRRNEEKFRQILDSIEDEYYEVDLKGNYVFANRAACKKQNLHQEQLIGMNFKDFFQPEDAERFFKIANQVFKSGHPSGLFEYKMIPQDGTVEFFEDNISLLKDGDGRPVGFAGIARNITERKKNEESLLRSEEKYRNILENIEEGYYEADLSGKFTFFNEAECRIHGRSPQELKKMNNRDFSSPQTAKRVFTIFNEVYKTGIPAKIIDYEIIARDGSIKTLETSASLLRNSAGGPIGFYGISRDVTERKKAEQALRESEEKYRNILNSLEESYYEVDLAGNFIFFNEAMCRSYGRTLEELMGMNYREYALPEDVDKIFGVFNEVYRTNLPSAILDFRIVRIDGVIRTIEGSVGLLRNSAGEPIGFHGIARDRTEQKKAEKALAESEEKYRLLVENANDGIYILQDGAICFSNLKMAQLTGSRVHELNGKTFTDLVLPNDREEFLQWDIRVLTGEQRPGPHSFRILNNRKETLWVEVNSVDIQWEERPATLNFLRDITLQKKMEAHFQQVQKMEAVGTLAGGIAHDFNNLLMGIQGNASLVLLDLDSSHPHYDKLKGIEQQVQAGTELTRQLLGSARGGKYEVKPTDMNQLIGKVLDLFGRTRKEISLHAYLQEKVRTVEVDRIQIEQVLLNLFINAGHAMPAGGDLYVETKNVFLDEAYVGPYGLHPGKYVRISVTDTGVGMDEETRKKAFDPFFTTKEMGRGTGLGLASAYGIIKNHNGIINIYSEKGQGTTFNIYLPVTDKDVKEEEPSRGKILKGKETILFVDDEEAIIQIGCQLLERLGYRVLKTRSGQEAVEIYGREKDRIDLIVLDMIMPGMPGGDAFNRLKEINPEVRVILSSGYSLNGQAKDILDRGCKGFLQKPFSLIDLSQKVRQVLDEKG
jgi:PAS domain S-box-containing protein